MKLINNNPPIHIHFWPHSLPLLSIVFVLCQLGSTNANLSNQTDQLALLDFKNQISNDPQNFFNSWNNSLHFCQWRGVTCGLRHQRVISLNLGGQNILGTLSPHIGNLTFLRSINLTNNRFHGEIPQQIGQLFRLRTLILYNNSLSGKLPVNLSLCSDLRSLFLGKNRLVGSIPIELGSLKKLDTVNFESNIFTGFIPHSFGNLSSLKRISMEDNNFQGTIPNELGRLTNLTIISVATNNVTGTIPSSLYNISSIILFYMADNQLTGTIPLNIGLTFPNLVGIAFGDNNFHGEIPESFSNASQLQILDIPGNKLTGQVPKSLGNLQNLQRINFADNLLGSNATNDLSFIAFLSNCSNLQLLELDDNDFGGELPMSVGNLPVPLEVLTLGNNHIVGIMPSVLENLGNLYQLVLGNNLLSGLIPSSLGKLGNLQLLDLQGNKLSGPIPSSLGNITLIYQLDLSNNLLEGDIPESLGDCEKLTLLDLSRNSLSGEIPKKVVSIFSLSISLNLSGNSLTGSLPIEVGRLTNINALDVSNNNLSGKLPETIGSCLSLEYLYIQGNFFQGIMPSGLAGLRGLREFDLSRNNFSGQIPMGFEKLAYLRRLNLSFNELEGVLPTTGVFENPSSISILGNGKFCGGIEELQLPPCRIKTKKPRVHLALKIVLIVVFGGVFIFALAIMIVLVRRKTKKESVSGDFVVESLLRVSYHDLHRATEGFSPRFLIGSGGFGSVYKGKLDQKEDKLVAVKVLNLEKNGASKSFIAECQALRNIRHRNLVKILTYCSSIDSKGDPFKALVYKYMSNGSLDMWLHPQNQESSRSLSFMQRLNIAIDVANAVQYLHDLCEPPIIHCDLKPSNILLDKDLIAHVGDFGLARIVSESVDTFVQEQSCSMAIKGSIGYAAPEYGMGGEATKYGDTYSYGVLLLEMLTGRRPTDDIFKDDLNLHIYVKTALEQEHVMMIVDPTLVKTTEAVAERERERVDGIVVQQRNFISDRDKFEKCIIGVLKMGVGCSIESTKERMGMKDVLVELSHIRTAFLGDGITEN